jgi:hypothetical protein
MMKRRRFLQALCGGIGLALTGRPRRAEANEVLLQESQLAGFEYYRGQAIWPSLRVGRTLSLLREPRNKFDRDAVAVYFHGDKLGFVPQLENRAIAQMLDRGQHLQARIIQLNEHGHPWNRVRLSISLTQGVGV